MDFLKINVQIPQDLKEDMKLLSEINNTLEISSKKQNENEFIDKTLSKGQNYLNPYEDGYVDPNQDSQGRLVMMCFVNKFKKEILVVNTAMQHKFFIPGGKPKIFEGDLHAAIRFFKQITGLQTETKKTVKLLKAKLDFQTDVTAFLLLCCQNAELLHQKPHVRWLKLEEIKNINHPLFQEYYKRLYYNIIQFLY